MSENIEKNENAQVGSNENATQKRKKLRGKVLFKIKTQMEFYFSYANIRRDRFLGNLVRDSPDGYVNLEVFLTFNRIKEMTDNIQDIVRALSDSEFIELSADKKKARVKNKQPPKQEKNFDECTIYVERLPQHCDHNYVANIFNQFGKINYITLPRFRNSSKVKGFAFIEFDQPEAAYKACEVFRSRDDKKTDTAVKSQDHKSHANRKESAEFSPMKKDGACQKILRKRKRSENEKSAEKPSKVASLSSEETKASMESEETSQSKTCSKKHRKRKRQSSESEVVEKRFKILSTSETVDTSAKEDDQSQKNLSESQLESERVYTVKKEETTIPKHANITEIVDGKLKFDTANMQEESGTEISTEMKSETEETENRTDRVEGPEDASQKKKRRKKKKKANKDTPKLRVLSKADWKIYRNKYLSLQKKAMSSVKKMLHLSKKQQAECEAMLSKSEEQLPESVVEAPEDMDSLTATTTTELKYQPGVIAKLTLSDHNFVPAELIKSIKSKADVAFIDVLEDKKEAFLRFSSPIIASEILENAVLQQFGSVEMVTGKEELEYWEKVQKDREAHINRLRTNKRGRDKIIAKATALMKQKGTHTHFDDSF